MITVSLPRPIEEVLGVLGMHTGPHETIPGDRPGQIAVLKSSGLFDSISLEALTDAQVELATFLVAQLHVVEVAQKQIPHGDPACGGHRETALVIVVSYGERKRVTVAALPCGTVGPIDLRI
jgi:hypothetical protein